MVLNVGGLGFVAEQGMEVKAVTERVRAKIGMTWQQRG